MKKLGLIAIFAVLFSACSTISVVDTTNIPVNANEAKIGTSECVYICGFETQKCSIDDAAKAAGITTIQAVEIKDFKTFFYDTKTIIVRGK
ncbi:TRL domain-containing protein [Helicobacter sp. 23-1045]